MSILAELVGSSPGIVALREQVGRLLQRQTDNPRWPQVLIQGETGTGKGLLAHAMHRAGSRRDGPFIDINCAAIPETLLEAEMFGFERGAFTDARQARPGLFQLANRGTIFLDEIGLLPDTLQSKLLKVIEERTVRRLGGTRSESLDIWIVTASNEDLEAAVRERRFREDLYHRLAVLTLRLAPLRERGHDILLLAEHFLARACNDYRLPAKTLDRGARAALLAYPWPGNARQLSNVMERVALTSDAPVVSEAMLGLPTSPAVVTGEAEPQHGSRSSAPASGGVTRERLLDVLEGVGWNLSKAAAKLGTPRNTLRYRLERLGLRPGTAPSVDASPRAERAAGPMSAPVGAAAFAGLRWEPRRLTLLRSILVLRTSDAAALYSNRALELVAEKVQTFGGRVEDRGTTGVVAVFGLEPVEDAPRRAAHTAMALQKASDRARDAGDPMAVKFAIHVGQFLVGYGPGTVEIDVDAKHEAWNVLDSLLTQAEPNTIVVSAPAVPFLERRFELVPLEPVAGAPAQAYRIATPERSALGGARRLATFIGRRSNLELLQSHLAAALRGHGQIVGIVGEAGIGKSRLIAEFRLRLAGQSVTFREGACLSYGSAVPYLPVVDVLRQNFGIVDSDSTAAVKEKVAQGLTLVGMDEEAAPYLLHLLGIREGTARLLTLTPEAIKLRTHETLRRMMLNASRTRPMILVVEDLHWIDKASEELFSSLLEDLSGAPIMFLATYRPGYRPVWIDRSYATQMALQPLSPEDSLAMVRSLLSSQRPEPVARLILDKAEGNPFFLEELCRAFEEQPEGKSDPLAPGTIHDVLLERIDRLPEEPRQLLQTASVLGREFTPRLLAAVCEQPGAIEPHLGVLTRLEFLYQRTPGDEPTYVFKHVLTQEVAYASLLGARRQALHAAAGRALETFYAGRLEEVYDRLAYHYSHADAAAKAVEYLTRFADRAARGYTHEEAVRALTQALAHAKRLPPDVREHRMLELVLRLPYSLLALGRVQEIVELLIAQRERVDQLGDPTISSHYYFLVGRACSFVGDHEQATLNAHRAIDEARCGGDQATQGKAYSLLALEAVLSGHALQGVEHAQRAVALLETTDERWWLADAYWLLGLNHIQTGDLEPALAAETEAAAIGAAIGDQRVQASAAWVTGVIRIGLGEHEEGIKACRRAVELAPDPLNTTITKGWLGFVYLESGQAAAAIPLLQESIQQLRQFRFREFESWFTAFLADAHRLAGHLDDAEELASQALQTATQAKFLVGVGWAQLARGRVAQAKNDLATAAMRLDEALRVFASVHSRWESARTHVDLATVAHARGDRVDAAKHLAEAVARFKALGVPRHVERITALAATLGIPLAA